MLYAIPSQLLHVVVELGQVLLEATLAGIHFLSFLIVQGHHIGDFGHLVVIHAVELSGSFAFAALRGVTEDTEMHQRLDSNLLEVELEAAHVES